MSLRIIGAGFGRTGTLSLKLALEQLGFDKCYHMMEVRNHPEHVN
ncbi:MAG: sulfotransferase family protein, partial [Gammaproteobacteria bacterium]|nr:sulfotransferase family protein [Gammaproteobacteria bacterium]